MRRKALAVGAAIGVLLIAAVIALKLPQIVYPEVQVKGYDPNPLQTYSKDLEKDGARRMVALVTFLVGLGCSVGVYFWLSRRGRGATSGVTSQATSGAAQVISGSRRPKARQASSWPAAR
jgi:hypothetical protein